MSANGQTARWLADARAHFISLYGPQAGRIVILVANDLGEQMRLTLPPEAGAVLPPLAEAVLAVLRSTSGPMPPKQLARRAGYAYNSRFRAGMADLVRRGLVSRLPDGYEVTPGT